MKKLAEKLYDIQERELSFEKKSDNPFFKSKYLSLEDLTKTIRPILKEKKLLIFHYGDGQNIVTVIRDMESDEELESKFPIQQGIEPQKVGSAITYAKRYNLGQLLNIITDIDDDGNATNKKVKEIPNRDIFQVAKSAIEKTTDIDKLKETGEKINKSDKYTQDQKDELLTLIANKI